MLNATMFHVVDEFLFEATLDETAFEAEHLADDEWLAIDAADDVLHYCDACERGFSCDEEHHAEVIAWLRLIGHHV